MKNKFFVMALLALSMQVSSAAVSQSYGSLGGSLINLITGLIETGIESFMGGVQGTFQNQAATDFGRKCMALEGQTESAVHSMPNVRIAIEDNERKLYVASVENAECNVHTHDGLITGITVHY